MSKTTVTRLFVGSLLAIVGGLVLAFIAAWVGYATSAFVMNGPDVIGVQPTSLGWTPAGVGIIAILAILGGVWHGLACCFAPDACLLQCDHRLIQSPRQVRCGLIFVGERADVTHTVVLLCTSCGIDLPVTHR
jgi:hypothetical protein